MEVTGSRELCFFQGKAYGAVHPGFHYKSEAGAVASPIRYEALHLATAAVELISPLQHNGSHDPSQLDSKLPSAICRDYSNGGPWFDLGSVPDNARATVRVLATYMDHDDSPAAVSCPVQSGMAVLCGTHPELHPDWLLPGLGCSTADAQQQSALHKALLDDHNSRRQFWRRLLHECRLGLCMHPEVTEQHAIMP